MIKNYFVSILRNLLTHKFFTGINILGLSIGLSSFLLINAFVRFEKSYDRFHKDYENILRVTSDQIVDKQVINRDAMSHHPAGLMLVNERPEILSYTTSYKFEQLVMRKGDSELYENGVIATDDHFLEMFNYPMIDGDIKSALSQPNCIVMTASKAQLYFGSENPIGKSVYVLSDFYRPFKVTGVIADPPHNTHYKFEMLISLPSIDHLLRRDGWGNYSYYTYIKVVPGTDIAKLEEAIEPLAKKYMGEHTTLTFNLQPIEDIHLTSDFAYEPEIHGSQNVVEIMTIISFFILVLAWVNYVNLSTARAIDRSKEVGLRKVIGANRRQLFIQFFIESFILNVFASIICFGILELTIPSFNELVGKSILHHTWQDSYLIKYMCVFSIIGTLLTGFYPSLVLSGFEPIQVLKGKFRNSRQGVWLRKALVSIQFAVSLILISCTIVVFKQVEFMNNRNKGFNTEGLIGFRNPPSVNKEKEKYLLFLQKLRAHEAVIGSGTISNLPGSVGSDISSNAAGVRIVGQTDRVASTFYRMWFDENIKDVLGMEVIAGRNFDSHIQSDSSSILVNEAFLSIMGVSDYDAVIGKKVQYGRDTESRKWEIIGVVKDMNRTALKNQFEPTTYGLWENLDNSVVKLSSHQMKEGIDFIKTTWEEFYSDVPFEYNFLDDRFSLLHEQERRFGNIFGTFSILAIIVGIIGLFGLSSFMVSQRTKEVGIRKVLGAGVKGIVFLFFKEFAILIFLAALAGIPFAYYGMSQWLYSYAFRISFPWAVTLYSVGIILIFTYLTVGYQTYKVAILNPSKTIRYE